MSFFCDFFVPSLLEDNPMEQCEEVSRWYNVLGVSILRLTKCKKKKKRGNTLLSDEQQRQGRRHNEWQTGYDNRAGTLPAWTFPRGLWVVSSRQCESRAEKN